MVSSIELFRRPGYGYLDELAVCGKGFVASVQVFLRRAIGEVDSIALDPASRAACALVRLLLHDRPGGPPRFLEVAAGDDPREVAADAWLRIGDAALREHHFERIPTFNPSEAWTQRTGLPFVFAPWIVRPGVEIEPYLGSFLDARARGAAAIESLAGEATELWEIPFDACLDYLAGECVYELEDPMEESLLAFRDQAARLGLCRPDLVPRPIGLPEHA